MGITYDIRHTAKFFCKTPDPMGVYVVIYKGNVYVRTFMFSYQFVVHGVYIHIYIYTHVQNYIDGLV